MSAAAVLAIALATAAPARAETADLRSQLTPAQGGARGADFDGVVPSSLAVEPFLDLDGSSGAIRRTRADVADPFARAAAALDRSADLDRFMLFAHESAGASALDDLIAAEPTAAPAAARGQRLRRYAYAAAEALEPVPEPAIVLLLGAGLMATIAASRRGRATALVS